MRMCVRAGCISDPLWQRPAATGVRCDCGQRSAQGRPRCAISSLAAAPPARLAPMVEADGP